MSSIKLLTAPPAPRLRKRPEPQQKRPFDLRAKADLRNLLAALRDIGDRPNLEQLLKRYDVSDAQLAGFIQAAEAEAMFEQDIYSR